MRKQKSSEEKTKQVRNSKGTDGTTHEDLYLTIVKHIKKTGGLPKWSISKQKMSYYVNKLKRAGVVEKIAYGTWEVKPDKNDTVADLDKKRYKKEVRNSKSLDYIAKPLYKSPPPNLNIRGHAFGFTVVIPRKIENWSNRRTHLKKKKIEYKEIGTYGESICVAGWKISLYDKVIVIYCPKGTNFYNKTAKLSLLGAIEFSKGIIKKTETLLKINIKTQGGYKFRVSKGHYSNIRNELAKDTNDKKLKFRCIGDDGKEWLLIDDSLHLDELESVHSKTGQKDMDKGIMPFFNGAKDLYEKTGESFTPKMILDMIGMNATIINQLITREAIRSGLDPTKPIDELKAELQKENIDKSRPSYVG